MNLDQVHAPRRAMEPIHILCEHPNLGARTGRVAPSRENLVSDIRCGASARLFDLKKIFPGDLWRATEHGSRQRSLDGDSVLGVRIIVDPTDAAVGGEP